jgi:hypothetical protein
MNNINKSLPVNVLKALKDFMSSKNVLHNSLYRITDPGKFLLKMIDIDSSSGFYFQIEEFDVKNGLLIEFRPKDSNDTSVDRRFIQSQQISRLFEVWYECLVAYNEIEEFYADPFLRSLENDFLSDFDLNDEAKNEPLTLKQIIFIEEYLTKIEKEINAYSTTDNAKNIEEIVQEAAYVKTQLGKQTKEWVAKKTSRILAKITKESPEILKAIFNEAGKQLMSEGIKFLLEHGNKLIL